MLGVRTLEVLRFVFGHSQYYVLYVTIDFVPSLQTKHPLILIRTFRDQFRTLVAHFWRLEVQFQLLGDWTSGAPFFGHWVGLDVGRSVLVLAGTFWTFVFKCLGFNLQCLNPQCTSPQYLSVIRI